MEEKKYTVRDIATAFSRDGRGVTVFELIQDSIDSSDLSFKLSVLEKRLETMPEYKTYLEKHNENIIKYGRKPDDKDPPKLKNAEALIDDRCIPDNIDAFNREESALLNNEIDGEIKKIPHSLFNGQKVRGTLTAKIFPFIDLEK